MASAWSIQSVTPTRAGYFSPWHIPTLEDRTPGEYLPDRLTDEALKLIDSFNGERPFFLNLWYYCVHTPIQAKSEKVEKFRKKARELGLDQIDPFVEGESFPTADKRDRYVRRRTLQSDSLYAAMIESIDENIGRLLTRLVEKGIADDTVVIFTSDNGGLATAEGSPTCNAPLSEGKGWMYEGGTREPLLIRYPGMIAPGSRCGVPVTSPDFYPTLLELAGLPLKPEQHVDGVSLVPLLKGGAGVSREAIFWHYPHYGNQGGTPGSSVRCGDWKLIEFFEDSRLELYNLRRDIGEMNNLAGVEPEIVVRLHSLLRNWRYEVEALLPAVNKQPFFRRGTR